MKRIMLIGLLVISIAFTACGGDDGEDDDTGLANPASVYCVEQGGTVEIRTQDDGSQVGYCIFDDGSECEEWAYYRDECAPGDNSGG